MNTTRYTYHATNDEADICSCCGKKGLKRVVWLSCDGNEAAPYGTTCAGYLLTGVKQGKDKAELAIVEAKKAAYKAHALEMFAQAPEVTVTVDANKFGTRSVFVCGDITNYVMHGFDGSAPNTAGCSRRAKIDWAFKRATERYGRV